MKKRIFVVATATIIGIANAVSAQSGHLSGQRNSAQSAVRAAPTPAFRAMFHKTAVLTRAATKAMDSGDYAEAEADARAAMAIGFNGSFADETLAAALDAQGKTQEALQAYKAMAGEGDVFPRNLLPYARLLLKTGNYPQAVWAYNKALPLIDNGELIRKSGGFPQSTPRPTELAAAIQTALGLQMDWPGYHGTYQEAIVQAQTHFQQALALEPNSPLTNYYVGYGLKRLGRQAEAQAAFKKAAALGQGDVRQAAQKELPPAMQPR